MRRKPCGEETGEAGGRAADASRGFAAGLAKGATASANWTLQQRPAQAGGCEWQAARVEGRSTSRAEGSAPDVNRKWLPALPEEGRQRKLEGPPGVERQSGQPAKVGGLSHRSSWMTERRSEPGKLATGRAGVGSNRRKSRVPQAGAARGRSGSESCRFAPGRAGGRNNRLYYGESRLKRQRPRSLAFSILGRFSGASSAFRFPPAH
jgi:hypothetical protein